MGEQPPDRETAIIAPGERLDRLRQAPAAILAIVVGAVRGVVVAGLVPGRIPGPLARVAADAQDVLAEQVVELLELLLDLRVERRCEAAVGQRQPLEAERRAAIGGSEGVDHRTSFRVGPLSWWRRKVSASARLSWP